MKTYKIFEERKEYPFIICPHCHGEITYKPDFGIYINYVRQFAYKKEPLLRLWKDIPLKTILTDPAFAEHKNTLHHLVLNIVHQQPLICLPLHTKTTPQVLKNMVNLGVITEDELENKKNLF